MDINPKAIIKIVRNVTGVDVESNINRRTQPYPEARQICFYCMRKYTKMTHAKIARYFNKDHSSVVYSTKRIEDLITIDKQMEDTIAQIHQYIMLYVSSPLVLLEKSLSQIEELKDCLFHVKRDYDVSEVIEDINQSMVSLDDAKAKLTIYTMLKQKENEQLRALEQKDTSVGVV